jgi:diguanylate cyclase (GGDEF)-like protein
MRVRYVLSLSILAAYFVASYFVLHNEIRQQQSMAQATAIGGQQRMFSQRITMFADEIVTHSDPRARARARADLEKNIRTFSSAHAALTTGDPAVNPAGWPPASVRELYFAKPAAVDDRVRAFIDHARSFDARVPQGVRADDPDLAYLLAEGPGPLLQSLDAVVKQYNVEQVTAIQRFELVQVVLLVLGLSTLAAVWFTILMPLEHEISAKTAALERAASLDSLTQVYNRTAFTERVETAIAHARRQGENGAMLMIDLDRFKTINDTFGHLIGDQAIVEAAERLRSSVRAGEYITRLGGDEFAIFAPTTTDLEAFVTRLTAALQFEITLEGASPHVSASIGVARFPQDAQTLTALFAAADRALYAAKNAGRATYRFYSSEN